MHKILIKNQEDNVEKSISTVNQDVLEDFWEGFI